MVSLLVQRGAWTLKSAIRFLLCAALQCSAMLGWEAGLSMGSMVYSCARVGTVERGPWMYKRMLYSKTSYKQKLKHRGIGYILPSAMNAGTCN